MKQSKSSIVKEFLLEIWSPQGGIHVWCKSKESAIRVAHSIMKSFVFMRNASFVSVQIWHGVPSPVKHTVAKWNYNPSIR